MHLWQFQPVRDLLIVAAFVLLLYLGHALSLVTVPMLLAMLLAYLFEPLVQLLTARRWFSRAGIAIAILVSAFFAVVVPVTLGVGTATVQGIRVAESLAANSKSVLSIVRFSTDARESGPDFGKVEWEALPDSPGQFAPRFIGASADGQRAAAEATRSYGGLAPRLKRLAAKIVDHDHPQDAEHTTERSDPEVSKLLETSIRWVSDNFAAITASVGTKALGSGAEALGVTLRLLRSAGHLGLTLFLTGFFFFFFSTGYGKVQAFWEGLIPERKKNRVMDLVQKMDRVIAGFVRGRLTICAMLMVYYSIAYWFIGVPAPLLLGPVIGALAIIPFITILAMPLAMVLMVLDPGTHWEWQLNWWWIVGGPIGAYVIERTLDDYVLTPAIQRKHTEMAVPAILFASLSGAVLAGVYGLLIAIPVAACLRILLKEVFWPRFRAWAEGRERDFLPISHDDDKPNFDDPAAGPAV
jgi:predicted PurR-regulated permease PerM